jgi:hypothetical protein
MKLCNRKLKTIMATTVTLLLKTAAIAQDGNAGINEANTKVRSYFAAGTNLMEQRRPRHRESSGCLVWKLCIPGNSCYGYKVILWRLNYSSMHDNLIITLYRYIQKNNPELLADIESNGTATAYLTSKMQSIKNLIAELQQKRVPDYELEEICITQLTADLRPSKYNYILQLMEEDFQHEYNKLLSDGLLQTEAINMVNECRPVFEDLNFSEENESNRFIRYAIIGMIKDYFECKSENEIVSNELPRPAKTK